MAYIVVNENMLKLLSSAAALIFLFRWVQGLYCLRWAQRLPLLRQPLAHRPRVSVVIAARDEEARVEQTLRHILVQEHIDAETEPIAFLSSLLLKIAECIPSGSMSFPSVGSVSAMRVT